MQRGAALGGNHANTVGGGRKRLLELRVEQTFSLQFGFQLLIFLLQEPFARRLHAFDNNLIVAARFIQRDIGAHQHLLPMLRAERDAAVAVAEHRAAHLGVIVF